ncbi:MAG: NUDIX domain-containing protein [Nocardioidaceae bacterium]
MHTTGARRLESTVRIVTVILVDQRGWVLLQERDEKAPIAANQWGLVGGHVEPGEDSEAAVYRELQEETGVALECGLTLWFDGEFAHANDASPMRFQVWVASTSLTDADIVVGEGRQIVFVDPESLASLDLGESAAHFVPLFLDSSGYVALSARPAD